MKLYKALMLVALVIVLIYQQVLIMDLRWQVAEVKAIKPAFFLVETTTGRQLKLEKIE